MFLAAGLRGAGGGAAGLRGAGGGALWTTRARALHSIYPISALVDHLTVAPVSEASPAVTTYRGASADLGWGRVYGGQTVAQALDAAHQSAPGRLVHSFQSFFYRPAGSGAEHRTLLDARRWGAAHCTRLDARRGR